MLHIVLVEPEIAPNTGNIGRLCAAVGAPLHLVGRLGFRLDEPRLRRAGCDYWPFMTLYRHDSWTAFRKTLPHLRPIAIENTPHAVCYTAWSFAPDDALVFGCESAGLPSSVLADCATVLHIPMPTGKVRSINLATAAGIVLYEALRQVEHWPGPGERIQAPRPSPLPPTIDRTATQPPLDHAAQPPA